MDNFTKLLHKNEVNVAEQLNHPHKNGIKNEVVGYVALRSPKHPRSCGVNCTKIDDSFKRRNIPAVAGF